jgi:hypothetical protein
MTPRITGRGTVRANRAVVGINIVISSFKNHGTDAGRRSAIPGGCCPYTAFVIVVM